MVGTLTHVGRLAISDTCTIIIVEITGSEQLNKEALKKTNNLFIGKTIYTSFLQGNRKTAGGGGNP